MEDKERTLVLGCSELAGQKINMECVSNSQPGTKKMYCNLLSSSAHSILLPLTHRNFPDYTESVDLLPAVIYLSSKTKYQFTFFLSKP